MRGAADAVDAVDAAVDAVPAVWMHLTKNRKAEIKWVIRQDLCSMDSEHFY